MLGDDDTLALAKSELRDLDRMWGVKPTAFYALEWLMGQWYHREFGSYLKDLAEDTAVMAAHLRDLAAEYRAKEERDANPRHRD